jgi:simple sugar transport system ATP-binding protein
LEVRAGEILGIGGVAGNGQDELFMALSGEVSVTPDMIAFDGKPIGKQGPKARRKMGVLAAPEERNGHAAVGDMSLSENTFLTGADRKALIKRGILNRKGANSFANTIIDSFDVRTTGSVAAAGSLSGGNLQKFVIGREVLQQPDIFVVNQPTWGVDAAAAAAIRQALLDLTAKGAAIIVISQDLDELLEVSDRFAALCEGALSEIRPVQGLTMDQIGLMMAGSDAEGAAHAEA